MNTTHFSSSPEAMAFSTQARQKLVTELIAMGVLHSPSIREAFLTIPREAFVPLFYEQSADGKMEWTQIKATQMPYQEYLTAVYTNQPLVTQVSNRGWPTSSSSMPSAMVQMLEALDVKPGQRVLEIGTGTGYNAALLSYLTGDPGLVTTIEYDEALAIQARGILDATIGSGIVVRVGDGFRGDPLRAPYDRLIATASVSTVPSSWEEQLAPEGRLVMDLQGSLQTSGFLVLEKTATGTCGHFLAKPLYFIPLVSTALEGAEGSTAQELAQQFCTELLMLPADHVFPNAFDDSSFRWFLQWYRPGCQLRKQKQVQRQTQTIVQTLFVTAPQQMALVRFRQQTEESTWHVSISGSPLFWDDLQQAYELFLSLGKPDPSLYQAIIEHGKAFLVIGPLRLPL